MARPHLIAGLAKAWRLLALLLAALLLQRTTPPADSALTRLTTQDARAFFPTAKRLKSGTARTLIVEDAYGNQLGRLLTTSPDADAVVGYSGPSNVLVALDNQERIVGTRILASDDTPEHVDTLRDNREFEKSLKGWKPGSEPAPKLEGFAGSTLTAQSVAESIQKRLSGSYVSLRFPTPLSLKEIQGAGFPDATGFEPNVPRLGWNLVHGPNQSSLGYVVRTSPVADDIVGYKGPTETLIAVEPDLLTLRKVVIRSSYDTQDYVSRIPEEEVFLKELTKWNTQAWAKRDLSKPGLDGVAGATFTSHGIEAGIKARFADDYKGRSLAGPDRAARLKSAAIWFFVLGALVMTFTPLHGHVWLRRLWQILLVAGLGLWLGQLLSLSLFAGWSRHGLPWSQAPGLLTLGAIALLAPWSTRRQLYCHHACPHGAAQELLGGFRRLRVPVSGRWHVWLGRLPALTLAGAFLAALAWPRWSAGQAEPFDAWILGAAAAVPLVLAVAGLAASVFIPQAYCKYGCPTGALLRHIRSTSRTEGWSRRDTWAAGLLAVGAAVAFLVPAENREFVPREVAARPVTELHGAAFGTTWTVKVRGRTEDSVALKKEIEAEINRIEFTLSHWRESSVTTAFNRVESTQPFEITAEFAEVMEYCLGLSRTSHGAYDVTVAPLTDLWGYGPAGSKRPDPTPAQIKAALEKVGWEKLTLDKQELTLRKAHPGVTIDLGSVLQGFAADHVAKILRDHDEEDFLIEVGGEFLAGNGGAWKVGIEDPLNPRRTLTVVALRDEALSTSGLYRARKLAAGKPVSHILNPKTGYPVEPTVEMACTYYPRCFGADGRSTMMIASGWAEAQKLAESEGLAVMLVDPKGRIWKSTKLKELRK
jgi:thiamine biosynthesis lipoprotein ApbE